MAGQLTPVGIVTKWLVAPAALLAFGYFVLGPKFGGQVVKKLDALTPSATTSAATSDSRAPESPQTSVTGTPSDSAASNYPAPDVSVSGHRVGVLGSPDGMTDPSGTYGQADVPKPRRHRRHRRPRTDKNAEPAKAPRQAEATKPPADHGGADLPPAIEDGGSMGGTDGGTGGDNGDGGQ